jgi:serine/threonine protein kinase
MKDMKGPQFVEFKDSFIIKGNLETHELWIVMKHYTNGDLSKTLRRAKGQRLEEKELGEIVTPVLEGLRQMHAEGMMHRDIKPANILVSNDGKTGVIADFGLAKYNEHVTK